ncbi:ABC transporter substrate-binding protein [Frankia sp. Cppng1_Ct_nod]|uniref:ABC transporter substrate-binding protein n=1 Tax=Frankia sp. Cppng1_Ct_nod TaxID=2897162 RepID=UPI0010415FAF|nr:ABC transporter substrate-binding protein [Frankia sp. Cppng1_Ct_nod]
MAADVDSLPAGTDAPGGGGNGRSLLASFVDDHRSWATIIIAISIVGCIALGWLVRSPVSAPGCVRVKPVTKLLPAETWVGQVGTQCIGFSDGGYRFGTADAGLNSLFDDIATQNAAVVASGLPVFTVIVATPLTGIGSTGLDIAPQTLGQGGVNELRGATLAQEAWNAAATNGKTEVKVRTGIRLLVANVGWQSNEAYTVARHVDLAAQQDHRLVGVLGFFQSVAPAERAVDFLNQNTRIPIVSSTASDDALTAPDGSGGRTYPWYFRIGPTNRAEAQAIVDALKNKRIPEVSGDVPLRPLIVKSAPAKDRQDKYSDNLAQDIKESLQGLPDVVKPPVIVPFPGSGDATTRPTDSSGTTERELLVQALDDQCKDPRELPNLLFYTGRTTSVNILLRALDGSSCGRGNPAMPIIAGDDAVELETETEEIDSSGTGDHPFYFADFGPFRPDEIPAVYPAEYAKTPIPDMWKQQLDRIRHSLISGHVMLAFDASLLLIYKFNDALINPLSVGLSADQGAQTLRAELKDALGSVCGPGAVPGASGYLDFDRYGDAKNRPVVIRKLDLRNGTFTARTSVDRFGLFSRPADVSNCPRS